ncbi:hypothetical protein RRF57_010175 [Xylaria bambusicola]|uniref:Uncharacterized protein n=1 Tax=Xylaria bambusicola TaxID=326684 RepID=A0AAN7Z9D9_9PEZI
MYQSEKCASPPGSTTSLDTDCPDYDQKRTARTVELMSQLKVEEGVTNVKNLVEHGNKISKSMHENLLVTQNMISCKAPGDPNSDSDSDSGSRDTAHLTPDGTEVIQKEYVLINGHYALITYRKKLKDVDPYLLLKLRQKREKELAKWEEKQKKGKGKGSEGKQGVKPCISEPLAQLTGMKANSSVRRAVGGQKRGGELGDGLDYLQGKLQEERAKARASPPLKTVAENASSRGEVGQRRQASKAKSSSYSSSSSSSSSGKSFKARAAQIGFHPTESTESIERQSKGHFVEIDDDPDIWLMIADEYKGKSTTEYNDATTKLTRGRTVNRQ